MSASAAFGSLDDLIHATLADFARCGIDSSAKLSLLESAWNTPAPVGTVDFYLQRLRAAGAFPTPDSVRAHLEQLVATGLFVREGAVYRLNDNPTQRQTLDRLRDFWSDPALRARAAAQLRYRRATA